MLETLPPGPTGPGGQSGGLTSPLVFVARQPILDKLHSVHAYELLYRSGLVDYYAESDGDFASRSVIGHSLITFGLAELTARKRAFINFTGPLLVQQTALVFPPDKVVVEVNVADSTDAPTVKACWALKRAGYVMALDAVVELTVAHPLLPIVDYVKVDFLRTTSEQRREIAQTLMGRRHTLIAEKVETREDLNLASSLGYTLFQGNYFQRPEIVSRQSIPSTKFASLQLVKELNQPDVDWDDLERIIKLDVGLSMKLLRYLNSAWFGLSQRIESLRHALILLGIQGLRQWVSLVVVTDLGHDRPPELINISLLRATMCERLAKVISLARSASNLFLVGLFSSLDALVGRPLAELLEDLAVPDGVRDALLGRPGPLSPVYQLVRAYESGDWAIVADRAQALGIDEGILPAIYARSIEYVGQVVGSSSWGKR